MTGRIFIIGLGPGDEALLTPRAAEALGAASDVFGYLPYVARVPEREGLRRHASDNRQEIERARQALALAAAGRTVAVVSSGDPGVFAMASAVFEAIEHGEPAWRELEVEVVPGISAMFAAAARLGAPLGHDFCALSLSDNLKPWDVVLQRLTASAKAGFVIALYNPISRARPWQLGAAFDALREILPPTTPVAFARAVSRPDERILVTELKSAEAETADMSTLVLIGSVQTRRLEKPSGEAWLYTPRRLEASS
ncbi:precorrin-3B C(17)-methyltransferase [Bradyrhizobium sp. WD16]|uniref:precorrin-3B C(17)-methyltransferase n=1 Tax=Bradyrhizobium sp. WD16 TaxID=1521768 RepID=UPI0020A367A5|nr:precorrin-3B C(17)-methyltransferase [Bradyrhizobium sp. WD16]UTD27562.1 precorrin-3B C(17)-methyltransferase [Bradyrhizobium sp. WD16]